MQPMEKEVYRTIRLKLGLTQVEIAKLIGVTSSTISRRENGSEPILMEADRAIRFILVSESGEYRLPRVNGKGVL